MCLCHVNNYSEFIKNKEFREKIMDFMGLVTTLFYSEYGSSRESQNKEVAVHQLPIRDLAIYINDNTNDEETNDEETNDEAMKNKIDKAFRYFLRGKYELDDSKDQDPEKDRKQKYQRSPEETKVRLGFTTVLNSDELIKMSVRDWHILKNNLSDIKKNENLDIYKDAINMMREDLKMDTDSRNLNKN